MYLFCSTPGRTIPPAGNQAAVLVPSPVNYHTALASAVANKVFPTEFFLRISLLLTVRFSQIASTNPIKANEIWEKF